MFLSIIRHNSETISLNNTIITTTSGVFEVIYFMGMGVWGNCYIRDPHFRSGKPFFWKGWGHFCSAAFSLYPWKFRQISLQIPINNTITMIKIPILGHRLRIFGLRIPKRGPDQCNMKRIAGPRLGQITGQAPDLCACGYQ